MNGPVPASQHGARLLDLVKVMATLRGAGFIDVRRHVELRIFSEYTARVPS